MLVLLVVEKGPQCVPMLDFIEKAVAEAKLSNCESMILKSEDQAWNKIMPFHPSLEVFNTSINVTKTT